MTAPGGIPPRGAGRPFERLVAAQLDAIAARLGDTAAAARPDAPAAARPGDRVEWSVVAESLATGPVASPEDAPATDGRDATRAVVAGRAESATLARAPDAAAPPAAPLAVDPAAQAPPALEPRVDANALRLALPASPHMLPHVPPHVRAHHASGAPAVTGARGVAVTGARGEERTVRTRVSRWRVALLALGIGAVVYVAGATLGARATMIAVAALAAVSLVRRVRTRSRRGSRR